MKRRDFLKLIGIVPIAPSILAIMPKEEETATVKYTFGVDEATELECCTYIIYGSYGGYLYEIKRGELGRKVMKMKDYNATTETVTVC